MSPLLDTHYHFDFLADGVTRESFVQSLSDLDVRIVAQTLTPSSFVELVAQSSHLVADGVSLPLYSLGLHPWFLGSESEVDEELADFAAALGQTRFIGEIGLDFSPRRLAGVAAPLQRRTLRQLLLHVCKAAGDAAPADPYVLSIHAVRSTDEVLGVLTDLDVSRLRIVPVIHRFSGSSDSLTRLIRLGGYVSVHPQMLTTKRGRAHLRQIPPNRLLLESDLPIQPLTPSVDTDLELVARRCANDMAHTLSVTLASLSQLRQCDMATEIARTQSKLYGVE